MPRRDFKAWSVDGSIHSEQDPCDVWNCFDAEQAATELVEGSDYTDFIDGDPIAVVVLDPSNGERRTFRVSVASDVVFMAEEVPNG